MKKFLNSKFGEAIILIGASIINLIFTIAFYSFKLSEYTVDFISVRGDTSFWNTDAMRFDNFRLNYFSAVFVALFFIGVLLFAISAVLSLLKNKKWTFYISVSYNLILSLIVLFVNLVCDFMRTGAVVCAVISVIVSVITLIFMILRRESINPRKADESNKVVADSSVEIAPRNARALRIGIIVCECLATLTYIAVFFVPLYTETYSVSSMTYYLVSALLDSSYPLHINIAFMVMTALCLAGIINFATAVSGFSKDNKSFAERSQKYMYMATFLSVAFFIVGYGLTFYMNLHYSKDDSYSYSATTTSYLPSVISVILLVVFSILQGRLSVGNGAVNGVVKTKKFKLEPLIYVTIITAITFASLALNLVNVQLEYSYGKPIQWNSNVTLSGYDLLKNYPTLEAGFQLMAFILLAMLLVSAAMLVVAVVSYFAKNNDYYKILKASAFANFVFALVIGLLGIYFKIVQKINEENILAFLSQFDTSFASFDYVSSVSTQSYFATIASFVMLIIMLLRGQFNLSVSQTDVVADVTLKGDERNNEKPSNTDEKAIGVADNVEPSVSKHTDLDVCPAFTELDMKIAQFDAELSKKQENLFANLTLPSLVRFVVDYARECRLHLSYSLEDMATFVAGLGASRLTILQGMSGTGKTSLPKIFTEALMGACEIVEVESSWRDKNELLGYYNEFSKCYTPKKFTQSLYKARLNPTVPTFIVLDEMNLSRIEYYFSDFLSLMENEEDKREIKLLNTKLMRNVDGQTVAYRGLTDGHTIKIPSNIWFIGTANRDESTFEISDKVYDRAQTMNFNKRAPKVHSFSEPLPQRFATYEMIAKLFEEAKQQYDFDAEQNKIVQKVEKLLMPYNISFGNRILKQMEDFVKIYCTCFGDKSAVEDDAVEKILLSKVVSKLENKIVENKQALVTEFNKLGLNRCSAFIQKLNED